MMKAIEELMVVHETPDWLFNATKTAMRWGQGQQVEEAAYVAAVDKTGNSKLNAYAPEHPPVVIDNRPAKKTK
jgi:hypothetical protein